MHKKKNNKEMCSRLFKNLSLAHSTQVLKAWSKRQIAEVRVLVREVMLDYQ